MTGGCRARSLLDQGELHRFKNRKKICPVNTAGLLTTSRHAEEPRLCWKHHVAFFPSSGQPHQAATQPFWVAFPGSRRSGMEEVAPGTILGSLLTQGSRPALCLSGSRLQTLSSLSEAGSFYFFLSPPACTCRLKA